MSDEEHKCDLPPPGAPAWMATFADLMSLLMCFFVLLLAFAEMDATKFKKLAASMSQAFGVQSQIDAKSIPKGTSIIAQNFSPGKPEPTPINEIYQKTDRIEELTLDVECQKEFDVEKGEENLEAGAQTDRPEESEESLQSKLKEQLERMIRETESDAVELAQALNKQIAAGGIEVETHGRKIIVRILEKGSFRSGSAELEYEYIDVLHEVSDVLASKKGQIMIEGHTDNIPIETARFRSNWDLSSQRAVSVAHELFASNILDPNRVQVTGFADTRPLVSNETALGRSRNRRVEIVVDQGVDEQVRRKLEVLKEENPEQYEQLQDQVEVEFNLRPSEIF